MPSQEAAVLFNCQLFLSLFLTAKSQKLPAQISWAQSLELRQLPLTTAEISRQIRSYFLPWCYTAFIGSGSGSLLATQISTEQLKVAIVVMLVAVFAYTLARPDLGKVEVLKGAAKRQRTVGAIAGLTIGFYDGFIGPGTGTLLMIVLVSALGFAFIGASAIAKVVNVATNFASILVFGISGSIMWVVGLAVGICNLAGGIIGSRVAIRRGSDFVRKFYLVVTFALIVRVLFDLF